MAKGKIYLITAAFLYGVAPIFAKMTYIGGANGITLTFLRTLLALPVLFLLMLIRRTSFKITKSELGGIVLLGTVGGTLCMVTLYISYDYISTGLATTLNFIYPLIIVVASAVIYKEKISKAKLLAVTLVTFGMFMLVDITDSANKIGIILALFSGILYSFYVIYMQHSHLDELDYIKLTFYIAVITSIGTFIFGSLTDSFTFADMNAEAWLLSVLISAMITLGAIPLFQVGVRYEGATTAGIISAVEPITSIVLGTLFLNEYMGVPQYFGVSLLIIGVILAEKYH